MMFLCNTDRDCCNIINKFKQICRLSNISTSGPERRAVIASSDGQSVIDACSVGSRGNNYDYLFIDESSHIEGMKEHWNASFPTLANGGKAFAYSDTNGKDDWFMNVYFDAMKKCNAYVIPPFMPASLMYTDEEIRLFHVDMGEKAFATEVMQCFI